MERLARGGPEDTGTCHRRSLTPGRFLPPSRGDKPHLEAPTPPGRRRRARRPRFAADGISGCIRRQQIYNHPPHHSLSN